LLEHQLDRITDELVRAESRLSGQEDLMQNRFLYTFTSGRVQRLRITKGGERLAAGAYVLEITPLTTDFKVLANVGLPELPYISVGQTVRILLAGNLPGPVFVPAKTSKISKATKKPAPLPSGSAGKI
jgi:membrane fusion protein, type I secretion system